MKDLQKGMTTTKARGEIVNHGRIKDKVPRVKRANLQAPRSEQDVQDMEDSQRIRTMPIRTMLMMK